MNPRDPAMLKGLWRVLLYGSKSLNFPVWVLQTSLANQQDFYHDPHRGDVRTYAAAANYNVPMTPQQIAALIFKTAQAAVEAAERKRQGLAA